MLITRRIFASIIAWRAAISPRRARAASSVSSAGINSRSAIGQVSGGIFDPDGVSVIQPAGSEGACSSSAGAISSSPPSSIGQTFVPSGARFAILFSPNATLAPDPSETHDLENTDNSRADIESSGGQHSLAPAQPLRREL